MKNKDVLIGTTTAAWETLEGEKIAPLLYEDKTGKSIGIEILPIIVIIIFILFVYFIIRKK